MGQDFSFWVQIKVVIDDCLDTAFFKIVAQDRRESNRLRFYVFNNGFS
jgi:hypothetical protein